MAGRFPLASNVTSGNRLEQPTGTALPKMSTVGWVESLLHSIIVPRSPGVNPEALTFTTWPSVRPVLGTTSTDGPAGNVVDVVEEDVVDEEVVLELVEDEVLVEDVLLVDEEPLVEEVVAPEDDDVVAALTVTVSMADDAPGRSGFGVEAVLTVPGQQWKGAVIVSLIVGRRISGAAAWSVAFGAVRLPGARFCSASTTLPPVGVHVVSPSAMGTLRAPARSVPVRDGSAVALGGVEIPV